MFRKGASVILSVILISAQSQATNADEFGTACKQSLKLADQCFTMRGRLIFAQGGWQLRIWPVGTKRLLAVVDPNGIWDDTKMQNSGAPYLTPEVKEALKPDENVVFADFTLCPLTKDIPGEMRHVCMVAAKNIITRPF